MDQVVSLTKTFITGTKNKLPNNRSDFKTDHTFNNRQMESLRVLNKYPDRVPIICQKHPNAGSECPPIDKIKYLTPVDLTLSQFMYVIRKRVNLHSSKALFLFIDGNIPPMNTLLSVLYAQYQDEDGFLYITYNTENTFG